MSMISDSQRADVKRLIKQRAKHEEVASFVMALAEWGFNYECNALVWEAIVSVIEADERNDLPAKDFEWTPVNPAEY